ncbi:hypothetical protein ACFL3R_00580 [Thermodesulfobacteriota bacterium]
MPTINDPNGTPMGIKDNGFATMYAASIAMEAHAAHGGDCYSLTYNIDPNVAGDFLYMKNASDKPLRIYKIKGHTSGTGGLVTIKTGVTGTPTTGVALTPINTLVGSGKLAEGTFNRNTSAASMALTGGNTLDILLLVTAVENIWTYSGEIALEKNQTLVLNNTVDPAAVMTWIIYFFYHEVI